MYFLKILLKLLIVLPVVALSSCAAGGYIGAMFIDSFSDFNWIAAIITSVVALFAYAIWDGKQEQAKFKKYTESLGIKPEYVASYGENGIAIDRTNEKVFAGRIKKGKIFEFKEISSIQWEDAVLGDSMKYMIHLNTKNFDLPQLTVGFAGNKGVREEAYAKLRAALNIS